MFRKEINLSHSSCLYIRIMFLIIYAFKVNLVLVDGSWFCCHSHRSRFFSRVSRSISSVRSWEFLDFFLVYTLFSVTDWIVLVNFLMALSILDLFLKIGFGSINCI